MEEELLDLLNQARTQGASEQQLQKIIDLYRSKKKVQPELQPNAGAGQLLGQADGTSTSGTAPVPEYLQKPTEGEASKEPLVNETLLPGSKGIPLSKAIEENPSDPNFVAPKPEGDYSFNSIMGSFSTGVSHLVDSINGINKLSLITDPTDKMNDLMSKMSLAMGGDGKNRRYLPYKKGDNSFENMLNGVLNTAMDATSPYRMPGTAGAFATKELIIPTEDKISADLKKQGTDNPLPNTFLGKTTDAVVQLTPTIMAMMATGGGAPVFESTGSYLTNNQILQAGLQKAAGPLTQYLAATKTLEGINRAYDEKKDVVAGGIEGFNEGVLSGVGLEGNMAMGSEIGQRLFNGLLKKGLATADGKLTEQALKSLVGTPFAFSSNSVAEDLANGRPINWENAGVAAFTALPFEAMHVGEAYEKSAELKSARKKIDARVEDYIDTRLQNSLMNAIYSSPEDITKAMSRPEDWAEINEQSFEKGYDALEAKTYQEKNSLHLEQIELQRDADIKMLADNILTNGIEGFKASVNNMPLPEETKAILINKGEALNKAYNPVEIRKSEIGDQVDEISTNIQELNHQIVNTPEEADKQAHYSNINDQTGQKVELQSELFKISHEEEQRQKAGVELANEIAKRTEQASEEVKQSPVAPEENTAQENADKIFNKRLNSDVNTIPVKSDFLENAKITDVHPNGDITIRDGEGIEETLSEKDRKALDISDDDITSFKEQNKTHYPDKIHTRKVDYNGKRYDVEYVNGKPGNITEEGGHSAELAADADKQEILKRAEAAPENYEREKDESEFSHKVRTATDPQELATMYSEKVHDLQNNLDVQGAIADYNGRFSKKEFEKYGDRKHISTSIARNYFTKKGQKSTGMDQMAMEMNNIYFNGQDVVTPEDIYQFAIKYPAGHRTYFTPSGNEDLAAINNRYREITGKNLRIDFARRVAEKYNVSNKEAQEAVEKIESPEVDKLVEDKITDLLHTDGLFTGEPDYDKIANELDSYLADPKNDFNLWHPVFEGELPDENQLSQTKSIIDEYREKQIGGQAQEVKGRDQGSVTGSENSAEIENNADRGQRRIPAAERERVAGEHEQRITEIDDNIDQLEAELRREKLKSNTEGPEENTSEIGDIESKIAELNDEKENLYIELNSIHQQESGDAEVPAEAFASKGKGEPALPEDVAQIKDAMSALFPNIKTKYYENVNDFNDAVMQTPLKAALEKGVEINAFVDSDRVIHFNPEKMNKDTQLHEQGHILTNWAQHYAPKLYEQMVKSGEAMSDIRTELSKNGYDLKDKQLFEEAFVTALGRDAAGRVGLKESIPDTYQRNKAVKFIQDAWAKFTRWVANKTGYSISDLKNVKDMPVEDFVKFINEKYLLSGKKVSDISSSELADKSAAGEDAQLSSDRPVRDPGESMRDFAQRVAEWKDAQSPIPPPPAEATIETKPGYDFNETSIKNRVTTEERRQRNLDKIEIAAKRDFPQVFDSAKEMVDAGKLDPQVLAESIIKKPRPLAAEETAALLYNRMRLYNDHRTAMEFVNEAMEKKDNGEETQARLILQSIEQKIEQNDKAARLAGYEQGLGLAARKMMVAEDYSLANQLQLAKIYNNGQELPAEVRKKFEELGRQLEEAQKKVTEYENNYAQRVSEKAIARLQMEVKKEQRTDKKQNRSKNKAKIDKKISDLKSSILSKIKKNNGLSSSFLGAEKLVEITPDLVLLAKAYIEKGIVNVSELVEQIHDDVKDHLEGVTKRDIRDAISGYGRTVKPNEDQIQKTLRELKSQARLLSALEDAEGGERPLRSGLQREAPSDEVRDLQRKVKQVMRENGIDIERNPKSKEDEWRSALDGIKSRLRNQITDLNKVIETGEKPDRKTGIDYDAEANTLKAERDRLKSQVEDIFGKPELSDEQRVAIAEAALKRSIDEYERRIKENDLNPNKKESKTPDTPELQELRKRRDEVKEEYDNLKDLANPKKTSEERALDTYKRNTKKKIEDLERRLRDEDYEPAPKKPPIELDAEGKSLQANVNKLKRNFDEQIERIKKENRTKFQKRLDFFNQYRRFVLLSSPSTLLKLTSAGLMRTVTTPLEEIIGSGLSVLPGINKISKIAPREGSASFAAEAKAFTEVMTKRTLQEMYRTVKEGKSELDELHDKDKGHERGWLALPGLTHAALKTIPKQNEYYRSLQKRTESALREGFDITDPDVQTSLQMHAFKEQNPELFTGKAISMDELKQKAFEDGKRSIFMQKNFITEGWNSMIKYLETQGKKGEITASIAKMFFPIIKVPTNFVAETSSYALGAVKAVVALRNGIKELTPEQADYVMRNLKKQSIGAAFFALGYFSPKSIGGYYTENEKRKRNDPQAGDLIVFGVHIPHWLTHAPVIEVMQMGATVRRVHDQYKRKRHSNPNVKAVYASAKGLTEKVPFVGTTGQLITGIKNDESFEGFLGELAKSLFIPPDVEKVAKAMDTNGQGKPVNRKKDGFIDHIKAAIPGLREDLKKKHKK